MVFFGDSLSDNGNLYQILLKFLPKSPPYFEGRFSNGYTWAERVGKYYQDKKSMDYLIYAYGGATAIFHLPTTKSISPTTLSIEVDHYLLNALFQDKSKALYAIWIGGNDYIFNPDVDPETETDKVVAAIVSATKQLASYGARNFLFLNLPDFSNIPFAKQNASNGSLEKLQHLAQLHNQKLQSAIAELKKVYPDMKIDYIDVYHILNDVIDDPNKYNEKYHTHLTNTTQACWVGGYLMKTAASAQAMETSIKQALIANNQIHQQADLQAMSHLITQSPELSYVYQMSQAYAAGAVPCANADDYVFWDFIHPTQTVHQLLSDMVIASLESSDIHLN